MEISSFSGLGTVLKTARGLLTKLQQNRLADEQRPLVDQALEVVRDIGDRILDLQTAQSKLEEENAALRQKVVELTAAQDRRSQYKLIKTQAGTFVYEFQAEPKHYACPTCLESKEEIQPLQPNGMFRGTCTCRSCKNTFAIEPSKEPPEDRGGSWTAARRG